MKRLDIKEFIQYMSDEFPTVFKMNHYTYEWLENTIQWVTETYESDWEKQMYAFLGMLPEIEEEEIKRFWK